MEEDKFMPEIDPLLKKMKLKKPSAELMANYAAEVNTKIDQMNLHKPDYRFPGAAVSLVFLMAFAGYSYFNFSRTETKRSFQPEAVLTEKVLPAQNHTTIPAQAIIPADVQKKLSDEIPLKSSPLSIEQEMAVLEAFDSDLENDSDALLDEDELVQEMNLLDEVEFSNLQGFQTSARM